QYVMSVAGGFVEDRPANRVVQIGRERRVQRVGQNAIEMFIAGRWGDQFDEVNVAERTVFVRLAPGIESDLAQTGFATGAGRRIAKRSSVGRSSNSNGMDGVVWMQLFPAQHRALEGIELERIRSRLDFIRRGGGRREAGAGPE